jgi:hypothetical protein
LDVAVGSGAVEMTKYLLEFHGARPTRETLKQAISTGNLELIKLMRERLPEGELRYRVDLLEVAAEFHQQEVVGWLLREATVLERELLEVFALELKLADSLVVALDDGLHPWSWRAREVSLKWRASGKLEFGSAPENFSSEGGWWTSVSGAASALPACGSRSVLEWTKAKTEAQLRYRKMVRSIVFPSGVTAIGESALMGFEVLESIVFPASCTVIRKTAFEGCQGLKEVSLRPGCKATGEYAFAGCTSIASVTIPNGCGAVNGGSFRFSGSLMLVRIPDGCTRIGSFAFWRSGLKEVVTPAGCQIEPYAFWQCKALTRVSVGCDCTALGEWAFEGCGALTTVSTGSGCIQIGDYAFGSCSLLASVTLPSSVQWIGAFTFRRCASLTVIAITNACALHRDAFGECNARVTRL